MFAAARRLFPDVRRGLVIEWGSWADRDTTEAVLEHSPRASLVLKADIRPGWTGELDGKVVRLEHALEGDA